MIETGWIAGKAFVPEITDERLQELMLRFTPLVKRGDLLHRIEVPDLRNVAYTWDPVLLEPTPFVAMVECKLDHYCGYHALFKPSIAEVLAQLPADLPAECNAFWTDIEQIDIYQECNGQRATTTFGVLA